MSYEDSKGMKEGDLVLNPNEYAFIRDDTKGVISCACGPYKTSLSTSDKVVIWDEQAKKFVDASSKYEGINTFITAPENFYVELKNPAMDNSHPKEKQNDIPAPLNIGKKVNIKGNVSFALYPGQMAKVIAGHSLRSNQYLLVKVYDADVLNRENLLDKDNRKYDPDEVNKETEMIDEKVVIIPEHKKYVTGELIIIKGTDVPFYIPPTGMEVIPDEKGNYIRNATTLEKLEYCILVNERGDKKYVHGPDVVFPNPDETFVLNDSGDPKYHAIELSPTSGIYVKVIGEYSENGIQHKIGEELFITGNDTMIYYPRAEHAIIDYDGKIVYHATEIPAGEGRYVLDRIKGTIKTVKGPIMYLPNPINEVFVQRKLTENQCKMWYPDNNDVLFFNTGKSNNRHRNDYEADETNEEYSTFLGKSTLNSSFHKGFSRGTTYYDPRTLTFDNKFKGVVTVDVWTGYAVNIVKKDGNRKVVTGPCTCLLDYDESLEVMEMSTGKPKTTDNLIKTVYLRVNNNKISDIIKVETRDGVTVSIKVSYCVDFLEEYKDKWFLVENYVKFLCDNIRSIVKREVKQYGIQEFYQNASEIVRDIILDIPYGDNLLTPYEIFENEQRCDECTNCAGECYEDNSEEHEEVKADDVVSIESLSVLSNERQEVQEENEKITENNLSVIEQPECCHGEVVDYEDAGRFFDENGMFVKDVDILSIHIEDENLEYDIRDYQKSQITSSFELQNKIIELEIAKKKYAIKSEIRRLKEEDDVAEYDSRLNTEKKELEVKQELDTLKKSLELIALNAKKEEQGIRDEINRHELERSKATNQQNIDFIKRREDIKKDMLVDYAKSINSVMSSITPDLISALQNKANSELLSSLAENMSPYAIARDESILDVTVGLTKGTGIEQVISDVMKFIKLKDAELGKVDDEIPDVN